MKNLEPVVNNFFMPAEWEQHQATWLAWPHDVITFPDRIPQIENLYVSIINYLHINETINLLVLNKNMAEHVRNLLTAQRVNLKKIIFHEVDYADVWLRDYGPTFLIHDKLIPEGRGVSWIKWNYNAYGNKFPDLLKDQKVFYHLQKIINLPMLEADMVMEGGAIDVNGKGILLSTEECLLNSNRNPQLNKSQTEEYLKNYLGIKKIIWLNKGIVNDHTDGHIDEVARFVNTKTIVCAYEDEPSDPNFAILDNNFCILKNATDQDGKPFNLIKIPMPKFNYDNQERAPASYVNFYIANKVVLMPVFGDKNDSIAQTIIQNLFPHHQVIGVNCQDLIYGGGTLHCITQQEPQDSFGMRI